MEDNSYSQSLDFLKNKLGYSAEQAEKWTRWAKKTLRQSIEIECPHGVAQFLSQNPGDDSDDFIIENKEIIKKYEKAYLAQQRRTDRKIEKSLLKLPMNDDIPVIYLFWYYPSNKYKDWEISDVSKRIRKLVFNFKDGISDEVVIRNVVECLSVLFENYSKKLTFVCVPASTVSKNHDRFSHFSKMVCQERKMFNGFEHVEIIKEKTPSHLGGTEEAVYSYDEKFFNGKTVVLFDDVITSGESMNKAKKQLENCGAKVLLEFAFARTINHYLSKTSPGHPWIGYKTGKVVI